MSSEPFAPKGPLKKTLLPLPSRIREIASGQYANDPNIDNATGLISNNEETQGNFMDSHRTETENSSSFASSSGFLNPFLPSPSTLNTSLPSLDSMSDNTRPFSPHIAVKKNKTLLSLPNSSPQGFRNNLPPMHNLNTFNPNPNSANTNLPPPGSLPTLNSVNANIPMSNSKSGTLPPPSSLNTNFPPPGPMDGSIPQMNVLNTNMPPPNAFNTNMPPPSIQNANMPHQNFPPSAKLPSAISLNTNLPPPGLLNTKLPPPSTLHTSAAPPSIFDITKPPPHGFLNKSSSRIDGNNSLVPPPSGFNTAMPPPGMITTSLPPPGMVPNFSIPPPGHATTPSNRESDNKSDYLMELKKWYKGIEDYENKMLTYFEHCAEKLREWHHKGGDQTEEYRKEYSKLTSEYENYLDYMQSFKEYYDQQVAEAKALSAESNESDSNDKSKSSAMESLPSSQPIMNKPDIVSNINDKCKVQVSTKESTVLTHSTTESVTSMPNYTPVATTNSSSSKGIVSASSSSVTSIQSLAPIVSYEDAVLAQPGSSQSESQGGESSGGDADYYVSYYKQMIGYFSQCLETIGQSGQPAPPPIENVVATGSQPPPPPPPKDDSDSGESSDESDGKNKPKLSRNQKKKLKKKKNQQLTQHKTKKERKLEKHQTTVQKSAQPIQSTPVPLLPPVKPAPPNFNPNMPPPGYQPPVFNMDPQSTMQMCLEQMNCSGKWDWASWNMYMNGIAQSNPQWFNIFQQFSNSMGLDWSEMSRKGKTNINYSSIQTGGAKDQPVSTDSNKKTIFNETKDDSPTKTTNEPKPSTDESDSDEPSDKSQPKWCKDCDQSFSNYHSYTLHLRGLKHMHNALDRAKKKNPEQFAEEAERERKANEEDLAKERKHLEWVLSQYKSEKRKGLGISGSFYCTLCNVECTSEKVLQFHLNGTKHTKNLEQVMQTGKKENQNKKPSSQKVVARIQKVLDTCLEALIGLEYVMEYQREDSMTECRYYCELCDHRFDPSSFIGHMIGVKHRKNYMKYNFYDMYEILDQDNSIKSIKAKRINIFAKKIEEFEGRKKMSVRMEISNPELKAQKLKEAEEKRKENEIKEEQQLAEARQVVMKLREERRVKRLAEKTERMEAAKRLEEHIREQEKLDIKYAAREDMEEGEILSEEEEESRNKESKRKRKGRSRHYSSASGSDSDGSVSSRGSSACSDGSDEIDIETEVRAEQERRKKLEEAARKEDEEDELGKEFNDFEMAEFEDVTTTERRPLAIQLKEDHDRDDFIRRLKEKKMLKLKEADKESLTHFVFEADWVLERCKAEEAVRKAKLEEEKERKRAEAEKKKEELGKDKEMKQPSETEKKSSQVGKKKDKECILPTLSNNFGPSKPDADPPGPAVPPPNAWPDMALIMAQMAGLGPPGPIPPPQFPGSMPTAKPSAATMPPSFAHSRMIAEEFNRKVQMGENPFSDPNFSQPFPFMPDASAELMGKRKLEDLSEGNNDVKKICLTNETNPGVISRPLLPTPNQSDHDNPCQPPAKKKTLLSTPVGHPNPLPATSKPNLTFGLIPDSTESMTTTTVDQPKKLVASILKNRSSSNMPLLPLPVPQSNDSVLDESESNKALSENMSTSDKVKNILRDLNLMDVQFGDNTSDVAKKVLLPLPLPNVMNEATSSDPNFNAYQRNMTFLPAPEKLRQSAALLPTPPSSTGFLPPPDSQFKRSMDKPLLPFPRAAGENISVNRSLLPIPNRSTNEETDDFGQLKQEICKEEFENFEHSKILKDKNQDSNNWNENEQKLRLPAKISILKRAERPTLSSTDVSAFNEDEGEEFEAAGNPPSSSSYEYNSSLYEPDNAVRYPGLDYPDRPAARPVIANVMEDHAPLSKSLLPTPDIPKLRVGKASEFAPPQDYYSDKKKRYDWTGVDMDFSYNSDKMNQGPGKLDRNEDRKVDRKGGLKSIPQGSSSSSSLRNSRKMQRTRPVMRNKPYDMKQNRVRNARYRSRDLDNLPVGLQDVNVNVDDLKAILKGVNETEGAPNESGRNPSRESYPGGQASGSRHNPFVSRHNWGPKTDGDTAKSSVADDQRSSIHSMKRKTKKGGKIRR